uniref:Uncharacterized protein n=1 Tax=Pinguiococcus pyrenoidosus TaxID=172671 RepID=A0A7R9UB82_9STRA
MDPKSFRSTTSNNLWRRRGGQGKRRAGVSSTHGRGASSSRSSKARSSSWSVPKLDDVLTVFGWEDDGVTEFSARDFEEPEDNFLNETMSIIDEELQSEGLDKFIREVFLHLVRAKYWDFIKAEVLPRGEMSTNVLLHSVDHALDFTTDGLFDFDYFRYKIGKKDWGAWGLTQLDYLWKVAFGSVSVAELLEEERRKDARRDRASFLSRSRSAFKGHKDEQHLTPKGKVFSSENNISAFQSARHLEDFDEVGDEEKGISGEQSGFRPPNLSGESYESEEDKPQIRYLSRLLNTVSGSWTKVDQKECREYSQEHIQQLEELLRTPVKAKYPHLANSKSACLHGLVLRLRTIEASRQADRYFGINAFVRAHMSAQEDVLRYFGSSESVAEHLKETIIRESKKSVAKAKRFLDETIDPHVVIRERWIQFAEIAIGTKRKHLQELTDQGMISDSNFEDIDEDLRQKLDDLRIMRHNIDRIFALREDEMEMEEIAERKQRRDNVLLRTLQRGAESIFGAATFRAQNTSVESFASVGSPKAQAPALSPVNEVQNPGHEAPEVKEAGMVTDVEVAELHDL